MWGLLRSCAEERERVSGPRVHGRRPIGSGADAFCSWQYAMAYRSEMRQFGDAAGAAGAAPGGVAGHINSAGAGAAGPGQPARPMFSPRQHANVVTKVVAAIHQCSAPAVLPALRGTSRPFVYSPVPGRPLPGRTTPHSSPSPRCSLPPVSQPPHQHTRINTQCAMTYCCSRLLCTPQQKVVVSNERAVPCMPLLAGPLLRRPRVGTRYPLHPASHHDHVPQY